MVMLSLELKYIFFPLFHSSPLPLPLIPAPSLYISLNYFISHYSILIVTYYSSYSIKTVQLSITQN